MSTVDLSVAGHGDVVDGTIAPAISVIIPAFEVAPWIGECLRSILSEDRVHIEVIVVDDGSLDETFERAAEIAREDARVRVVRAEGQGGGQARNQGARLARGKYLMFSDADDLVAPDGILRMHQAAVLTQAEMVIGDFLKFSASETWSPTVRWDLFEERRENVTLADVPGLIRNRACWNRLFERSFWERQAIRFPTVPRSNDIVPMTLALTGARRISVIPDVVYLYRERPGNGSMTSQAGSSAVGSISYLREERVCRALVESLGNETLNAVYWGMLLESDAWVQAERYIGLLNAGGAHSAEVEELIGEFVRGRRARSWERVKPEKQAVLSFLAAGRTAQAVDLLADFRRVPETEPLEFFGRQLDALELLMRLGDATPRAISELYARLILAPLDKSGLVPTAVAHVGARAREIFAGIDVDLQGSRPTKRLTELHVALLGGDASALDKLAVDRSTGHPKVVAVSVSAGFVTIDLDLSESGGRVVAAEARRADGDRRVGLSIADGTSGATVRVDSSVVADEGAWHIVTTIEKDGQTTERRLFLDGPDLVPPPGKFDAFGVRRPSTRQPLTVVRRATLMQRARRLMSA